MAKNLQIINKRIDNNGIHLVVKNKNNGNLHIEGHNIDKKDLGNKPLLRSRPEYMFPMSQGEVNEYIKGQDNNG